MGRIVVYGDRGFDRGNSARRLKDAAPTGQMEDDNSMVVAGAKDDDGAVSIGGGDDDACAVSSKG